MSDFLSTHDPVWALTAAGGTVFVGLITLLVICLWVRHKEALEAERSAREGKEAMDGTNNVSHYLYHKLCHQSIVCERNLLD